jgi:hypothetical protein
MEAPLCSLFHTESYLLLLLSSLARRLDRSIGKRIRWQGLEAEVEELLEPALRWSD